MNATSNPYDAPTDPPGSTPVETIAPQDPKPRIWPLFAGSIAELGFVIVLQVAVVAWLVLSSMDESRTPAEIANWLPGEVMRPSIFTLNIFLAGFSMILCSVLFGYLSARNHGQTISQRLGAHWPDVSAAKLVGYLLGSVPVLLVSVGAVIVLSKFIEGDDSVLQLYENITTGWAILFIVVIGLLPGIGEELFFRGFIQRRLLQRFRPGIAIGLTSVVFGLFHVTPHGILLATIIGVWLGVLAWRTGSIWPSACCHAFINSGWNVYQVGRHQWGIPDIPPVWFLAAGGLLVLAAFVWSIKNLAATEPC